MIVGLGNPGPQYAGTRHNAGFLVLERLRQRMVPAPARVFYNSMMVRIPWHGQEIHLLAPQTYINRSGPPVAALARDLGLKPEEILVCHDCLDLAFGRIRLRPDGSSGGHRGIASIMEALGDGNFPRLRIGIGRPTPGIPVPDYVTSPWDSEEMPQMARMIDAAVQAIITVLEDGMGTAMNRWNGWPESVSA
jgi:PTH1 family peptidyl-tRNA hydrolase